MDASLNPAIDISEAREIALGGHTFKIPKLMLRQTSRIGPHMPAILAYLNRRVNAANLAMAGLPRDERGEPILTGISEADAERLLESARMTEAEIDLAIRVVHIGITRAHPRVTLDDILDLPASTGELPDALMVIVEQTALLKKADASGEAGAASR